MADLFFGGGLNETDPFHIQPGECTEGENFSLDPRRQDYTPRDPQDLKGTATNGGTIRGIMQMIDGSDVDTMLIKSDNIIYSWDGTTFTSQATDLTTSSRFRSTHYGLDDAVTLNGILVITDLDKNDVLYKWDGTTFSRMDTGLVQGTPAAVTTLTVTAGQVLATHSTHGFSTGDWVQVAGASDSLYNGCWLIDVPDDDFYSYTPTTTPVTSPVTTSITDALCSDVKAKYSIVKDGRVWLFNLTTDSTNLDHMILASKFEDPFNFDTSNRGKAQDISSSVTGTDPFFLYSPDLRQINGVVEFFNQIIISTVDGGLYKLSGDTPETYNFVDYYKGSSAAGTETIVNTGNDVFYMKKDGGIERLSDTDRSGDISSDDASLFIPSTKKNLVDPQAVYDQANQLVLWFESGFILAYDKESAALNPQVSPWMKWTTQMPNSFTTQAATYVRRPSANTYTVLWGDSVGRIYDLHGSLFDGDSGTYDIATYRKTKFVSELPTFSDLTNGRVQYRRAGACNLVMSFDWAEEYNETTNTLPLKGPIITGDLLVWGADDFYWNEDDYWNTGTITGSDYDNKVSTVGFSTVGKSLGFFLKVAVTSTVKFLIDKVSFDEPIPRR